MKTIKLNIFAICALLLTSYSSYYYIPTQQNVLRLKQKEDMIASYGVDENGFKNYTAGYSITDHLGVISDFKTFNISSKESENQHRIDDFFWDNEIVFYTKFKKHFYPAINIGYGFGQLERNDDLISLKPKRQFIQSSIGYSGDIIDFALSTRLSRANYSLEYESITAHDFSSYNFNDVGKKDFAFLEPAVTIGVGYKNFKRRLQLISVSKLSASNLEYIKTNKVVSVSILLNKKELRT